MSESKGWLKVTLVERVTHTAYLRMPDGKDGDLLVGEAMNRLIGQDLAHTRHDTDVFIWDAVVDGESQSYQVLAGSPMQAEAESMPAFEIGYSDNHQQFFPVLEERLIASPTIDRWVNRGKDEDGEDIWDTVSEPYSFYVELMANNKVGDEYVTHAGAPGVGHTVYKITRMDETGVYGFVAISTVRELEPSDVY